MEHEKNLDLRAGKAAFSTFSTRVLLDPAVFVVDKIQKHCESSLQYLGMNKSFNDNNSRIETMNSRLDQLNKPEDLEIIIKDKVSAKIEQALERSANFLGELGIINQDNLHQAKDDLQSTANFFAENINNYGSETLGEALLKAFNSLLQLFMSHLGHTAKVN